MACRICGLLNFFSGGKAFFKGVLKFFLYQVIQGYGGIFMQVQLAVYQDTLYEERIVELLNQLRKFKLNTSISFLSGIDKTVNEIKQQIMQENREDEFFPRLDLFEQTLESINKIKVCHEKKYKELSCSCKKSAVECVNKMQQQLLTNSHKSSLEACHRNVYFVFERIIIQMEEKVNKWSDFGIEKIVFSWNRKKLLRAEKYVLSAIKISKIFLQNKNVGHIEICLEIFEMHRIIIGMMIKRGNLDRSFLDLIQRCKRVLKKRGSISDKFCYSKFVRKNLSVILYFMSEMSLDRYFFHFVELLKLANNEFDDADLEFVQDVVGIYVDINLIDKASLKYLSFLRENCCRVYKSVKGNEKDVEYLLWAFVPVFKSYLKEICGFIKLKNYSKALDFIRELRALIVSEFGHIHPHPVFDEIEMIREDRLVFDCCLYISVKRNLFDEQNELAEFFGEIFSVGYMEQVIESASMQLKGEVIQEKPSSTQKLKQDFREILLFPKIEEEEEISFQEPLVIENEELIDSPELNYMISFLSERKNEISALVDIFNEYVGFYETVFGEFVKEMYLFSKPLSKWKNKDVIRFIKELFLQNFHLPENTLEILNEYIQIRYEQHRQNPIYQNEFLNFSIKEGGVIVESGHIYLALFPQVVGVIQKQFKFLEDALIRISEKSQNGNEKSGKLVVKKVQNHVLEIKLDKYRAYSSSYIVIQGKRVYLFDDVRLKIHESRPQIQNLALKRVYETPFFQGLLTCNSNFTNFTPIKDHHEQHN